MADEISGQQAQVGFAPPRGNHSGNSNHVSFVGVLGHYQAEHVCFDRPQDYQEVVPEQLVAQQVRFDPAQDYQPVERAEVVAQQVHFDPGDDDRLVEPA